MPESDLERMQRQLEEDHAHRRAETARTIGLERSRAGIDDLTRRIERAATGAAAPATSPERRRAGVEWMIRKGALLGDLAHSPDLEAAEREAWRGALGRVTLTDDDEDALAEVLDAMRVRAVTIALTGPSGAWSRLSALVRELDGLVDLHRAYRTGR